MCQYCGFHLVYRDVFGMGAWSRPLIKGGWHGLGLCCPYWPKWPSGPPGVGGGTVEQRSECTDHRGWAVSSSCGGRELLRAGVPERCRPAGSERWRHLVEGGMKGRLNRSVPSNAGILLLSLSFSTTKSKDLSHGGKCNCCMSVQ